VWEGQVFVSLGNPAPIESHFAGVRERAAPLELASLKFARRVDYEVGCNWKVYVDNFLEGYHVPHVHPELMKLYDFQSYRTEVHPTYSLQHSPLSGEESIYSSGQGEALYYQVFPNFMLNILPSRLQTNVVLPVAADRCRVIFRYYYDDVESAAAQRKIADDLAYSDKVQQEDIEICQRVQQGLQSRAYDRGRFSVEFEGAVYHFQKLLKESYRAWRASR
jgi:choline monooxygenase